jgi:hypothetical protein
LEFFSIAFHSKDRTARHYKTENLTLPAVFLSFNILVVLKCIRDRYSLEYPGDPIPYFSRKCNAALIITYYLSLALADFNCVEWFNP